MPSSRYWPGCTSAIPTRARKGARIVFRAMMARVRAICASATSRSARVRSSSVAGTMPCWRKLLGPAQVRLARGAPGPRARAARPPRPRRRAPRAACRPRRPPPAEPHLDHPARHLVAQRDERVASTVPIDEVVPRYSSCLATAAVTASIGSGWLAEAACASRNDACFETARKTPAPAISTIKRDDRTQTRRLMWPSPNCVATLAHTRKRVECAHPAKALAFRQSAVH